MVSKSEQKSAYIPTDVSSIPEELRGLKQWICWRFEDRNGKETKLPCDPKNGREVDVQERAAWVSFDVAMQQARSRNDLDGIGFAFADGGGLVGIDLDDCLKDGRLTDFARSVVDRFPSTYAEVSPSGAGLKLWVRGSLPISPDKTGRKNPKRGLEVYQRGRYFTITGQRWIDEDSGRHADSEPCIVDHSGDLAVWFREQFPDKSAKAPAAAAAPAATLQDAAEIVRRASEARNGEKFRRLYEGDLSDCGDDHSSADLALCNSLAFWCCCDAGLMDQVFRSSGLMREKWERADYRESTIAKAIESCSEVYSGSVAQVERVATGGAERAWEPLIPITAPEPAEILASDIPGGLGQFARELSESSETPAALAVFGVLGCLAVCCQKKFRVQNDGCHSEPLSLYLLTAAQPGERKSAVLRACREPLQRWESQEAIRLKPEIEKAVSERKTLESRISHVRTRAAKTDDASERAAMMQDLVELERELPQIPALPVLTTSDCTLEGLASLMQRQGERMAVVSDEGGIFENLAGIYTSGQVKLDLALQGFSGDSVSIVRAAKDPVVLQNPALSFLLSVQPSVLQEAASNPAFRGRGLVQRFLYCVPRQRVGYRVLPDDAAKVSDSVKALWERICVRLLNEPRHENEYGDVVPRTILLTAGARRIWKDFQREIEPHCRPGGPWHFETGWASKLPGSVARIAGVLHCAMCAADSLSPDVVQLNETTMKAAVDLGRKLEQHALAAFSAAGMNDVEKLAAKIAGWIRANQEPVVSSRQIQRGACSDKKQAEIEDSIEMLIDANWIRLRKQPAGRNGRPPVEFEVSPEALKLADNTDRTSSEDVVVRVSSVSSAGAAGLTTDSASERRVVSVLSGHSGGAWSQFDSMLPVEGR